MRLRVGATKHLGPVMLTAVGRWALGLKFVLHEMCEEARRGFVPEQPQTIDQALGAVAEMQL